jgi:hypothetical protein
MSAQGATYTVLNVLGYLHAQERAAEREHDRIRLFSLRAAWAVVWTAYVWRDMAINGLLKKPPLPVPGAEERNAKPWYRELHARPLRRVVKRESVRPEDSRYDWVTVNKETLSCGHVIYPPEEWFGKTPPRRRRCPECGVLGAEKTA